MRGYAPLQTTLSRLILSIDRNSSSLKPNRDARVRNVRRENGPKIESLIEELFPLTSHCQPPSPPVPLPRGGEGRQTDVR